MGSSIKLFQFVQRCNQTMGICLSQAHQKSRSTILTKTVSLICSAQIIFTTAAFLVFRANALFDYGFAFYMLITETNSFVIYIIFIWQRKNTSKFIEDCEGFIAKSKCQSKVRFRRWIWSGNWIRRKVIAWTLLLLLHWHFLFHSCISIRLYYTYYWISVNELVLFFFFFCFFAGSHSTDAYTKLVGKIELLNKGLCFAIGITIASLLLAGLPYTLVRYYMFHMEEESFHLFCPSWFVLYLPWIKSPHYRILRVERNWSFGFLMKILQKIVFQCWNYFRPPPRVCEHIYNCGLAFSKLKIIKWFF